MQTPAAVQTRVLSLPPARLTSAEAVVSAGRQKQLPREIVRSRRLVAGSAAVIARHDKLVDQRMTHTHEEAIALRLLTSTVEARVLPSPCLAALCSIPPPHRVQLRPAIASGVDKNRCLTMP